MKFGNEPSTRTEVFFNTNKTYSIQPKNVKALKQALLVGPISISLNALNRVWSFYTGGIIHHESCESKINHSVIGVGYGRMPSNDINQPGREYVIIKNSWGSSWGENGYARVAIDTVVRQGYVVVAVPATEANIKEFDQKKADEEEAKAAAKKERADRDERIKETRRKYEEEQKAAAEAKKEAGEEAGEAAAVPQEDAQEDEVTLD